MIDVLLIGPTLSAHPSRIGGTTTSFSLLLRYLREHAIDFKVISTNRWRVPAEAFVNAVYVLARASVDVPRAGVVMLNANPRGAVLLGPLLYLYCRLWRRPFVFRMFGGDLIELYDGLPSWLRTVFRSTVLRADLVLLQTRRLVEHFEAPGRCVRWLPNAREPHAVRRAVASYRRRLVFVGSIRQSKGVDQVLRFLQAHRDTHVVDLYGPIAEPAYASLRDERHYRGVVAPDDMASILAGYDLLLLPTQHPGEGYPGVVIEANSVGLPVIATHWLAIPELVRDGETGLLTPPGDYDAFEAAILSIDEIQYKRLSSGALSCADDFSTTTVYAQMMVEIDRVRAAAVAARRT